MDYEIIMPVLSDTMDKGKLVKWRVHEGDVVHKGDVIAEVESDKAIMEVQTFKDGVVKKLLVQEGQEVPVKAPIAIIDISAIQQTTTNEEKSQQTRIEQKQPSTERKPFPEEPKKEPSASVPPVIAELLETPSPSLPKGEATPAAKKRAAELGIDIQKLQRENQLPKPAHIKDIEEVALKRYFTPKAFHLLQQYAIDPKNFSLDHKITYEEVKRYIKEHNIPQILPLSKNRVAVIENVQNSAKKPVYFLFEELHIKKYENIKLTSLLIKKLGNTMQKHPLTRAKLDGDRLKIYPHSNISVAVAKGDDLFMVVCKNVEERSLQEIDEWVRSLKNRTYSADELMGSTFGISNLGMFGVKRFTAMINKKDVGIAAFGVYENEKVAVTFTFDHRIMNGVDAAKFVNDLKSAFEKEENV